MEKKTCYIINFYFGDRRFTTNRYKSDRLSYLFDQISCLSTYKHSLTTIIFNFNVEPEHYGYLNNAIKIIPPKIQQSDVEVNIRENYGMSYGAYSDIFSKKLDKYDYYIFNEDDYLIVQNNFDEYLINKFESLPNCGYFCGLVREFSHKKPIRHAGMSSGISSYECLKKVYDKHGELPHAKDKDYLNNEIEGQTPQTNTFINLGYDIYDIREEYRLKFWSFEDGHDTINIHFFWNTEDLFLPAKVYENEEYIWKDRISPEFLRMECDYKSEKYYDYG
jgi:hypothetical protein